MQILILIVAIVSGVIGSGMASSRGKSPVVWGIVCFLFPLFGLLILAFSGSETSDVEGRSSTAHPQRQSKTDWKRWQTLIEVDPDIEDAAKRARAYGPDVEAELAEKYFALNDKSYLPALSSKIIDSARREIEKHQGADKTALLEGEVPISGEIKGIRFRQNPDGSYMIIKGKLVGRTFRNYAELQTFMENQ